MGLDDPHPGAIRPSRRVLAGLVLLLAIGGCRTPPDKPVLPEYRAWCVVERKFLTAWDTDRIHAEEARRFHHATWPHHQVTILTRYPD